MRLSSPRGVSVKLSWGVLHLLRASLISVHAAFLLLHSHQQRALLTHTLSDGVEQNPEADPASNFPVPPKSP